MGDVGFFERGYLFGCEFDGECGYGVGEVIWFGCADDGRGDDGLAQHPREGEGCAGDAAFFGELAEAVYYFFVGVFRLGVDRFAELVGFGALGCFGLPGAGEFAAGEWAPGDDADAFGFAEAHHLALFFAVEEVVVVLHRDEARPVVEVCDVEGLGELPGVHGGGADVADFAGFDDVVESFHGLFDGGFVVPAMDLVEVDVVGLEAAKTLVELKEDLFAGEALAVGIVAHDAVELGGDDGVFPAWCWP